MVIVPGNAPVLVYWYFVPDEAKDLGFYHRFSSRYRDGSKDSPDGLGEQLYARFRLRDGRDPALHLGGKPDGPLRVWQGGGTADDPPLTRRLDGYTRGCPTGPGGGMGGGAAVQLGRRLNILATGGGVANGAAVQFGGAGLVGAGGAVGNGSAILATGRATIGAGGAVAGGNSPQGGSYSVLGAGGARAGGSAVQFGSYAVAGSGGAVAGGIAIQATGRATIGGGGAVAGGVALQFGEEVPVRGAIDGFSVSKLSNTTVEVSPGSARDGDNTVTMDLASSLDKRIDLAWAVGTGAGIMLSGSVAALKTYDLYAIRKTSDGSVDVGAVLSGTPVSLPAGYGTSRLIGAYQTNASSQLLGINSLGQWFYLGIGQPYSGTVGATRTAIPLTVPTGRSVVAIIESFYGAANVLISSPMQADETVSASVWSDQGAVGPGTPCQVMTDTAGQIYLKADGAGRSYSFRVTGWLDFRGQK